MTTVFQSFLFARHIPPSQIARRVWLNVRRRALSSAVAGRKLPFTGEIHRSADPPLPLFPARRGRLFHIGDGYAFEALGRQRRIDEEAFHANVLTARDDQLWAMNLHYMEYLEEAGAGAFDDLVRSWLAQAQPYTGAWWARCWNSYTVSLRTVVWCQQLASRDDIASDLRQAMEASLAGQLQFLAQNLETDIGGNHLVKNAKALIWGSAYFTGPTSQSWRRIGLRLLTKILAQQVLEDGVHYERSPSYHAQVFADLLECRWALCADPLDGRLDAALMLMAQATIDLAHPDGACAQFNDAGLTMAYSPSECLQAYAALFVDLPRPRSAFAFSKAGYYGARTGGDYLIVDCGPIGPDELPAHAHADVLSFELSIGGRRVIVDPGVFEYVAGSRRAAARSAASHNTVCVEGADQADFFAGFRVGRRPRTIVEHLRIEADEFELQGVHDGFAYLPGRPLHRRRFRYGQGLLEIRDVLDGRTDRRARARFLLSPKWRVDRTGPSAAALHDGRSVVRVSTDQPMELEDAVWWPDMGRELATQAILVPLASDTSSLTTWFEWIAEPGHRNHA